MNDDYALEIGRHGYSGQRIRIPFRELFRHWHVAGKTNSGKTKLLELLCRAIIDAHYGLVVIDGKGDLASDLVAWCAQEGLEDRTVIIDPTNSSHVVPLNLLKAVSAKTRPGEHARRVIEALKKIFGEDEEFKPWLEEWNINALLPLIQVGHTLADLERMASIADPEYRHAVFAALGKTGAASQRRWAELKPLGLREAATRTAVVRTRAYLATSSEVARCMFGLPEIGIDWQRVLDHGGIVIVNANTNSEEEISKQLARLVAVTVLLQVQSAARARGSRPRAERRNAFLVIDEFQEFLNRDLSSALAQMRSFKCWHILSNQSFPQIAQEDPTLASLVKDQCTGKVYFGLGNEDAEQIVNDLYQERIHGRKIKHRTVVERLDPVESVRVIQTRSSGSVDSVSSSSGSSIGDSDTFVFGDGSVVNFAGDAGFFGPTQVGSANVSSQSAATAKAKSSSSAESRSHSEIDISSQAVVPFYEFKKRLEEAGRQHFSPDEIKEELKARLMLQPARRCQFKLGITPTFPLMVKTVNRAVVLPEEARAFAEAVFNRTAIPLAKALEIVDARIEAFVAEQHRLEEEAQRKPEIVEADGRDPQDFSPARVGQRSRPRMQVRKAR